MMDQGQKKWKIIEALKDSDVSRSITFEKEDRGKYLTNYAYEKAEAKLLLSKNCRAILLSSDTFNVYTSDLNQVKGEIPPSFYHSRKVQIIQGHFIYCSCGLLSRMKYPCRHIMSMTNGYHIKNWDKVAEYLPICI